jgi:prepilin signal peptidase PulO-like enzyme (type II secretory pathway)
MIKLFIFLLVVLSIYDIRSKTVPVRFLLAGSLFTVAVSLSALHTGNQTWIGIAAAMLPGLLLLIGGKVTGSIGYADGWLMLLIGIFLGFQKGVAAFCLSLFLTGLTAIILLLLGKGNKNMRLPYIPFLTVAVTIIQIH